MDRGERNSGNLLQRQAEGLGTEALESIARLNEPFFHLAFLKYYTSGKGEYSTVPTGAVHEHHH